MTDAPATWSRLNANAIESDTGYQIWREGDRFVVWGPLGQWRGAQASRDALRRDIERCGFTAGNELGVTFDADVRECIGAFENAALARQCVARACQDEDEAT